MRGTRCYKNVAELQIFNLQYDVIKLPERVVRDLCGSKMKYETMRK